MHFLAAVIVETPFFRPEPQRQRKAKVRSAQERAHIWCHYQRQHKTQQCSGLYGSIVTPRRIVPQPMSRQCFSIRRDNAIFSPICNEKQDLQQKEKWFRIELKMVSVPFRISIKNKDWCWSVSLWTLHAYYLTPAFYSVGISWRHLKCVFGLYNDLQRPADWPISFISLQEKSGTNLGGCKAWMAWSGTVPRTSIRDLRGSWRLLLRYRAPEPLGRREI